MTMNSPATNRPLSMWMGGRWFVTSIAFTMIVLTFVIEVPGLWLMDRHGVQRTIHGTDTIRVFIVQLFGARNYSLNLWGWSRDLDKIIAYCAAAVAAYGFRSIYGRQTPDRFGASLRCTMAIAGTIGAALITYHYAHPDSNHYRGVDKKGLFDAIEMVWNGDSGDFAVGLLLYRASYLLMSPVAYFIFFASIAGLCHIALSLSEVKFRGSVSSRPERLRLAGDALSALAWASVPLFLMMFVHLLLCYWWGMSHFKLERGRIYIFWLCWLCPLVTTVICIRRLVRIEEDPIAEFWKAMHLSVIGQFLRFCRTYLTKVVLVAAFLALPVVQLKMAPYLAKSLENRALGVVVSAYLEDDHEHAAAAVEFDQILHHAFSLDSAMEHDDEFKSIRAMRPLLLVTVAMIRLGLTDAELSGIFQADIDGKGHPMLNPFSPEVVKRITQNFPMFDCPAGQARLSKILKSTWDVWCDAVETSLPRGERKRRLAELVKVARETLRVKNGVAA